MIEYMLNDLDLVFVARETRDATATMLPFASSFHLPSTVDSGRV